MKISHTVIDVAEHLNMIRLKIAELNAPDRPLPFLVVSAAVGCFEAFLYHL